MSTNRAKIITWQSEAQASDQPPSPPSQEEVEARLHQEGYESYKWYDVPGVTYPTHRHPQDECLWILKGELSITVEGQHYLLTAGDRIYLPARAPHTASVPQKGAVTYVVGQRPSAVRPTKNGEESA